MHLRWGLPLLLGCLSWARAEAQPAAGAAPESTRCRAADIELYDGGGDAGLGHSEQIIELRNRSQRTCTLLGPPLLLFFDEHGKRLAEPYGRNTGDYMFGAEPMQLVTLQPGEFAHFKVGMTSCNNEDGCYSFYRLEVVLPGDYVPLNVGKSSSALMRINVSAVRTGADTEAGGWVPPTATVSSDSGELTGLSLRMDIPKRPVEGFTAHFAVRNDGAGPVQLASKSCVLTEKLANSAETTIEAQQTCGRWIGAMGADGMLAPGAVATMDMNVAGDGSDDIQGKMCRAGAWTAELEMVTDIGRVHFPPVPFDVKVAQCSDSEKVDVEGAESIRWSPVSQHGVRLGLLVRAKGNADPAGGRYFNGEEEPAFQVGDRVELRLFLDNMTDQPLRLNAGSGTFRLLVRRAGWNVPADLVTPTRAQSNGAVRELTVPPHTQKELGIRILNDSYDLPVGDYELEMGPPGHLTGAPAAASTPTTGWPFPEDAATVRSLIKVVPN
jgi:hypothetical protein